MKGIKIVALCAVVLHASIASSAPGGKAAAAKLSWAPPKLDHPETIELGDHRDWGLKLKKDRDFIIKLPKDRPFIGELNIYGGHNVVLIGGEIRIPDGEENPDYAEGRKKSKRAVYIQGSTGTVHIEGIHITGKGLHEGFNIAEREPGCIVQLQNIRVELLHGSYSKNHADVIQSWAGPAELRIDRLTGFTEYQGFFLLPNQHFPLDKGGFLPTKWDFRNINLVGDLQKSAYMLWCPDNHGFPIEITNVWVRPAEKKKGDRDAFLWPKPKAKGDKTWEKVKVGIPPGGDFVPEGVPGLKYRSPGYVNVKDSTGKTRR